MGDLRHADCLHAGSVSTPVCVQSLSGRVEGLGFRVRV